MTSTKYVLDNTLREKYVSYLLCKDKSEATIRSYTRKVEQMLKWIDKDPTEITKDDLDRYKVYMKKHYDQNSLAPHSIAINHFFDLLGKTDLHLKAPRKITKNVVPLTENEIQRMLDCAKRDPMDYAILTMLYYSQLRRTELTNLNVSDIDFDRMKIRVNDGKGRSYNEINLHPDAVAPLKDYIEHHREPPLDGGDALFVSADGTRLGRTAIWRRVKLYAVEAGIKKRVYPHLFRHSSITHMSDRGATLQEIQRQSRHKDVRTLMNYIHPSEQHCREVYLKTLPSFNNRSTETESMKVSQPQSSVTNATCFIEPDRELMLIDALATGRISEETFNLAIEILRHKRQNLTVSEREQGVLTEFCGT
jgi:integrase/recombinase XerD